jgi:hypothetical protein
MSSNYSGPFIERCPHDKENPYAQTSRSLIRDNSIHPAVSWMLIYLLSMKDGWKITPKQIINHVKGHFGCGRDKVYDWIKEACDAGYMKKDEWLDGNLKRCRYLLSEYPKFKKSFPHTDDQDPDCSDPANTYYKKEQYKKKHKEEEKEEEHSSSKKDSPAAQTPSLSFFKFKRVKMKMEAYDKLIKDFGMATVEEMLERLEEYADINPKRFKQYANHATVIRKWIREDAQKGPKKTENQINDMQEWLRSHEKRKWIVKAVNTNTVIIGKDYVEFKLFRDGYVKFTDPKAKMLIDHLIRKSQ